MHRSGDGDDLWLLLFAIVDDGSNMIDWQELWPVDSVLGSVHARRVITSESRETKAHLASDMDDVLVSRQLQQHLLSVHK